MKKRTSWIALVLILALCAGLLSGCSAKTPEYTVTFDLNGGTLVSGELEQKVLEGESAAVPEAENGRMILSWDGSWENVTSDRTIRAKWTKQTFEVEFDLNGGTLLSGELKQTVEDGDDAEPPTAEFGRRELSWGEDWKDVTSDRTVKAEWNKVEMNTADLAEYVQERTVTVNVETLTGGTSTGSGFIIDNEGTIVTNFHVIDLATDITVEAGSGATYPVQEIVDFSNIYDLAVLKINMADSPYLDFAEAPVRTGEQVWPSAPRWASSRAPSPRASSLPPIANTAPSTASRWTLPSPAATAAVPWSTPTARSWASTPPATPPART